MMNKKNNEEAEPEEPRKTYIYICSAISLKAIQIVSLEVNIEKLVANFLLIFVLFAYTIITFNIL